MNISLNSYPVLLFYAVFGYISTKIEGGMSVLFISLLFLSNFRLKTKYNFSHTPAAPSKYLLIFDYITFSNFIKSIRN